jgi:Fe-S cluster biogenesis protein NfuA
MGFELQFCQISDGVQGLKYQRAGQDASFLHWKNPGISSRHPLHRWIGPRKIAAAIDRLLTLSKETPMEIREKVEQALDKARVFLQADGGDVELVDVTEAGIVKVRLMGACGGCPMATLTLKKGIERILKQEVPEVQSVEQA